MTRDEFTIVMHSLRVGAYVSEEDRMRFFDVMEEMMGLLDEGDADDAFGTEGWRHVLGWD